MQIIISSRKLSQLFKLDWVIMSIVLLCLMAMALYGLLGLAERRYLKRLN